MCLCSVCLYARVFLLCFLILWVYFYFLLLLFVFPRRTVIKEKERERVAATPTEMAQPVTGNGCLKISQIIVGEVLEAGGPASRTLATDFVLLICRHRMHLLL